MGPKLGEVSYLTDQSRSSDRADAFEREHHMAIGNPIQLPQHLSLNAFDKAIIAFYGVQHQPDLQKHAVPSSPDADRLVRDRQKALQRGLF